MLFVSAAHAQDWLGFHGLEQQGVGPEPSGPAQWPASLDVNWKTPVKGFGYSSPVVAHDKIYLTTAYEVQKGETLRFWFAYLNQTFSWILVVIAGVISIRVTATEGYGRKMSLLNGGRSFLIMSGALLILGVCVFAESLFDLQSSSTRSWKIGTAIAFVSFCIFLLLMPWSRLAPLLFAILAAILAFASYTLLPQRDLFFNSGISGGIIATCVILLPPVLGFAGCIAARRFTRTHLPDKPDISRVPVRIVRVALYCALPALFTMVVLWGLALRMVSNLRDTPWHPPEEPATNLQLDPQLGWPFIGFMGLFALVAIWGGSRLVSTNPLSLRSLPRYGATAALFLALTCFLYFSALSREREIAHAVVCIDKRSGTVQWLRQIAYSTAIRDFKGLNSHATPTVAAGSNIVCAYFGSPGLYGLDGSGKVSWKVADAEFESPYGIGHSPVVADGVLIIANENERYPDDPSSKSHIIAHSIKDGRPLWRQERARSQARSAGFSSPIVRTVKGRKTIFMRGWEDLTGYDLHTGEIKWTLPLKHRSSVLVSSLVSDDKYIYVLDGVGLRALDLEALAEKREPVAWLVPAPAEKVSTPVLVDGLLFFATDTGVAFCVDVDKKRVAWRQKLGGRFFSSVVAHGDNVIFIDESGRISIVDRGPAFKLIAQLEMGEKVYATPVPQRDGLLVRGATNLFYVKASHPVSGGTTLPDSQ